MKFSACWIVKNEEKTLPRSIESLQGIVDELIVVDTGSEDRTVEIAREYGARVYSFAWTGDFSAARNHALSLVKGDIILFPDADEWFVPALGEKDRADIQAMLASDPALKIIQSVCINVDEYGGVEGSCLADRIFRKTPDLVYVNRIHEHLNRIDGLPLKKISVHERWKLYHTGYQKDFFKGKLERNIDMLQKALSEMPEGDRGRLMQICYLMREYQNCGRKEEALPWLLEMLKRPADLRYNCERYGRSFLAFYYYALDLAVDMRPHVSRRLLRERLVTPVPGLFPTFPGAPTIDLVWQSLFSLKEDVLLNQLDAALAKARKLPPGGISQYRDMEGMLCYTAARAYWRRGEKVKAMEYALEPFKTPGCHNSRCLHILLRCVKGQPVSDTVAFLASAMDTSNPENLRILVDGTRMEGFQELHAYYVKKQIEAGTATNGTFLFLQLLLGKHRDSLEVALGLKGDAGVQAARDHILLLAVCTGDEAVYRAHAPLLAPFADVLDAFFAGKPLETVTAAQIPLLFRYDLIAFAAGVDTADRFKAVFAADTRTCYLVKTQYLLHNQRYADLLAEDYTGIDPLDADCHGAVIEALLMLGRWSEACDAIKRLFDAGGVQPALLHQMLVVSEKAPDDLRREARRLYDAARAVYERIVDLADVVNTGVAFDDYDKKAKNALRLLNRVNYRKQLDADAAFPATGEFLDLCRRCAAIYEEQDIYPAALECYRMMAAHNFQPEESRAGLSRMFGKLGNQALAGHSR